MWLFLDGFRDPWRQRRPPTLLRMTKSGRVVVRTAVVLMGIGLLLIAFVAYQLWGTAFYEARAQSHLKSELAHQLHHALPTSASGLASHRSGLHFSNKTAPATSEPAINDPVGLLSIPRIGLLDAIVEGVGEAQLEQGPGHYPGTALPGEPGNVAIAGHRTTYAHPFYNLDALAPGDPIYILTPQGLFHYTVTESQVVSPTDVAVLETVPGRNTLTLTTCTPRYSAAQRLVVTAAFDGHTVQPATRTTTKRPKFTSNCRGGRRGGHEGDLVRLARWGFGIVGTGCPLGPPHRCPRRGGRVRVALGGSAVALRGRPGGCPRGGAGLARVLRAREPRPARQLLDSADSGADSPAIGGLSATRLPRHFCALQYGMRVRRSRPATGVWMGIFLGKDATGSSGPLDEPAIAS